MWQTSGSVLVLDSRIEYMSALFKLASTTVNIMINGTVSDNVVSTLKYLDGVSINVMANM